MYKNKNRSSTGIPRLDEVLHGGLISERLYLVDGNPGAGKTTLALQFLLEGIRTSEKCLYVTLSETKQELQAGAHSHGWDLAGIEIIELVSHEGDLQSDEELTMLPPSEVSLALLLKIDGHETEAVTVRSTHWSKPLPGGRTLYCSISACPTWTAMRWQHEFEPRSRPYN